VDVASAPPAECFEVSWLFVDVCFDEVLLVRDDFNEVGLWFGLRIHEQIVPLAVTPTTGPFPRRPQPPPRFAGQSFSSPIFHHKRAVRAITDTQLSVGDNGIDL